MVIEKEKMDNSVHLLSSILVIQREVWKIKELIFRSLNFYSIQLLIMVTGNLVGVLEVDFLGILLIPLSVTVLFFLLGYIKMNKSL